MTRRRLKTKTKPKKITKSMGQLAVDVYETDNDIVLKAPIAGVSSKDIEVSITDDVISIEGERKQCQEAKKNDYFIQECYWGSFSRSYILPIEVDGDKGQAEIKDGILTVTIPKTSKSQKRVLPIGKG
jgi:HSP20 family protein